MINAGKAKAVGKLLLKLETRSRSGNYKKLIIIYIAYLIPGLFIPWLLIKQNMDVSGFEFSFITYILYSLTICFTVLNELDNIIITKSEAELFSALPIDDRLIINGKMYMMLRYYLFLSIPLLLPGSIYYYSLLRSFPRSLLYLISGFMMILFISNVITLVYTAALKIFNPHKIGSISFSFQVVFIFFLFSGYQMLSYGLSVDQGEGINRIMSSLNSSGLINVFPQAWYALIPSKINFEPGFILILKILLPIFICQMSYLSIKWYLEANYKIFKEKYIYARTFIESGNDKRGFFPMSLISNFIKQNYLRSNLELSSYGLLTSFYLRDKTVRLSIAPMIIIPVVLALFALITGRMQNPFDQYSTPVFHISILICILIVLNTALLGIRVTNYPGAVWIYEAFPMESKKSFKNGIRKFFIIRLILPVFAILFIVMIFEIPFHLTALHLLFLFSVTNLYNTIFIALGKSFPFTKENTFINSIQRLTFIIFPVIYGGTMSVLMHFLYNNINTTLIAVILIFTATFWLNYFTFHTKVD